MYWIFLQWRIHMCCELKKFVVHCIKPNPSKLRLRMESSCWSSKNVPLFIKRKTNERKKKTEVKEKERRKIKVRKASPESLSSFSLQYGWGCGGTSTAGCTVGNAFYAIRWFLPVGPGVLARWTEFNIRYCAHAVLAMLLPSHGGHGALWLWVSTQEHIKQDC